MADYLTTVVSRAVNQLLLIFGGVFFLAMLLNFVAGRISEAGESAFGRSYRYAVAPGIVCHEAGYALGCVVTGTRIDHYDPFDVDIARCHRWYRSLDHHRWYCCCHRHRRWDRWWPDGAWHGDCLDALAEFVICSGPIWFGCLVIWALTKLFAGCRLVPDFSTLFPCDPIPSSFTYWSRTVQAAWRMFVGAITIWKWRSTLNVLYLYLVFCIASEMSVCWCDLQGMFFGFLCVAAFFLLLNVIPAVGAKVGTGVYLFCRKLLPIHATMLFVLMADLLFVLLVLLPLQLAF